MMQETLLDLFNATKPPDAADPGRRRPAQPDQSPAELPDPPVRDSEVDRHGRWPPDSLPNPMPGVDPQQTPGIDRLAAGAAQGNPTPPAYRPSGRRPCAPR